MARLENTSVQPLLIGTAFLAGIVVAALTALPFIASIGESFACAFETCGEGPTLTSAAAANWMSALASILAIAISGINLYWIRRIFTEEQKATFAQSRSYIDVSSVSYWADDIYELGFNFTIRNSGNTEAHLTRIETQISCEPSDSAEKIYFTDSTRNQVPAQQTEGIIHRYSFTQLHEDLQDRSAVVVRISGTVFYKDAFSGDYTSEFSYGIAFPNFPPRDEAQSLLRYGFQSWPKLLQKS